MAIQKKFLTGTASSKAKQTADLSGKKPEAKPAAAAKSAETRKLAVARMATAKLVTAKLMTLRKLS